MASLNHTLRVIELQKLQTKIAFARSTAIAMTPERERELEELKHRYRVLADEEEPNEP